MNRGNKKNKAFLKGMAATLALTSIMGSAAGCTVTQKQADNSDKIVIKVENFGGGIGKKWLEEAGERFKDVVKDKEYAPGKKGVSFDIVNAIGVTCSDMKTSGTHVYFLQDSYNKCYTQIQQGSVLDISDIVREETLEEFGESGKIEDKLNENYRFAMKGNDGKYYMLPHYEIQSGASYDVDLFEDEEFYLAEGTNGTPFNCALTGQTVYFTGDADEKTVGNDGVKGTDDDGMPTTLNELVAMCDHMMEEGVVPFSVAGSHIDYTNYFIEGLWTALAGYEQRNAVVAHTGTVQYVTGLPDTELWAGSEIYAPITEEATLTGSIDGYKAINQAARYYAFAFVELAYQQDWFYERYDESNYTHKDAMRAFILNGLQGLDKIGAHLEGSYWYNEAETYNLFNDYKMISGTGTTVKNIAHWHMPTSYGNDVVTGEGNKREEAIINGCTSTAMINGNLDDTSGNEGIIRACKDFLKFLSTEKELQNFTACTGVSKALYDYTIDESVLADLDPYQQTIMRLRANNRAVNQYGDNATYRAKAGFMTYGIAASGFHPVFDGVEYMSPLEAYYKKGKNAWECFDTTGFSQTKWEREIYAAD